MFRVLFLCTGNSARSQMAEAVLNRRGKDRFVAESAGSEPAARVNPYAIQALREEGIEWPGHSPRGLDGLDQVPWDFVITVCDQAREACPIFPGHPMVAHWSVPDPAAVEGDKVTRRGAFRDALTLISRQIDLFLALPLEKLERLAAEARVQAIGQAPARPALLRRGLWLNYLTIGYNTIEAVVSLGAGVVAGSVALVGFGIDSGMEVTASAAAQWRLRSDHSERRERAEQVTRRIIGGCFVALAVYVTADSAITLWQREAPQPSVVGLAILSLSVVVMPLLARQKRNVARALDSRALQAEAMQTSVCAYLSVIALAGVALNIILGWWWADPVAALSMVPLITKEGLEGLRGGSACDDIASAPPLPPPRA